MVEHAVNHAPAALRWAIGGRDEKKLRLLAKELRLPAAVGILTGDAKRLPSMLELVSQVDVVLAAAGPFEEIGRVLLKSCVQSGTHYCDICGEEGFIHDSLLQYHNKATKDGICIVHSCGLDSLPSDLGVSLVVADLQKRGCRDIGLVKALIERIDIQFSGGTIESTSKAMQKPQAANGLTNHYLNPPDVKGSGLDRAWVLPSYDTDIGKWTVFYPLTILDGRVCHRSAAFSKYGPHFHLWNRLVVGSFFAAVLHTLLVFLILLALSFRFSAAIFRHFLFKPGEGASKETMKNGRLVVRFIANSHTVLDSKDPHRSVGILTTPSDPGYSFTAVMSFTAAQLLAEKKFVRAGVVPPSVAFGESLLPALQREGLSWKWEVQK